MRFADNLNQLLESDFEEIYEEDTKAQTIRKIARTQNTASFWRTRNYLRNQLLAENPARKNSLAFELVIDEVLTLFYYGPNLEGESTLPVGANSVKHALKIERENFEKDQKINTLVEAIQTELFGMSHPEAQGLYQYLIEEKYNLAAFSKQDQDEIYNRVFTESGDVLGEKITPWTEQELIEFEKVRISNPNLFSAVQSIPVADIRTSEQSFGLSGELLLETNLFWVRVLIKKGDTGLLSIIRKSDQTPYNANWNNGFCYVSQKSAVANLLPNPKDIDLFEKKIQEVYAKFQQ